MTIRSLAATLSKLHEARALEAEQCARLDAELAFAEELLRAHPSEVPDGERLLERAIGCATKVLADGGSAARATAAAEEALAPLGALAKSYTMHCVGHAHIDMNWMWGWPETVAIVHDTFATVDRLMDEFPDFVFAQSQASVYRIVERYLPETLEMVRRRVREGRWEVTASHWVEADKNLTSGEAQCRQLLQTRRYLRELLGLDEDSVRIDWEPDLFGHAHTVPTVLAAAGVRYYYFCRAFRALRGREAPRLFRFQGKDGSSVLAYDDSDLWYLGPLNPRVTSHVFDFERTTGLKRYLVVYGVGDHGGGPTRRDLRMAKEMDTWPIYPRFELGSAQRFFEYAEQHARELPVVSSELNFVFEGCYVSQSLIKRANRTSENSLEAAERAAVLGAALAKMPYPHAALDRAWQHALLCQFHDILPGSGVADTTNHALGLLQETLAECGSVRTRAYRQVAGRIDTSFIGQAEGEAAAELGGGAGSLSTPAGLSAYGSSGAGAEAVVVFNPSTSARHEVVRAKLWDRSYDDSEIAVLDDEGHLRKAQVLGRGEYWGHRFTEIAFSAHDVPALGYRAFGVVRNPDAPSTGTCSDTLFHKRDSLPLGDITLENEYLLVTIAAESGALRRLVEKKSGHELVPRGELSSVVELVREAPHGMSAWTLGQPVERQPLTSGAELACPHNGPELSSVRATRRVGESRIDVTYVLRSGSPRLEITIDVDWHERGTAERGIPGLRLRLPLSLTNLAPRFECANGWVDRAADGASVPALRWVDVAGDAGGNPAGIIVANDSTYGYIVDGSGVTAHLLRSSYDPDPLPEAGKRTFGFVLEPYSGRRECWRAVRAAEALNQPLAVVNAGITEGELEARCGLLENLTPAVLVTCVKRAEDGGGLIIRLVEVEGEPALARVRLAPELGCGAASALETDLMERPKPESSAKLCDGVLEVRLPAFGLATVRVG